MFVKRDRAVQPTSTHRAAFEPLRDQTAVMVMALNAVAHSGFTSPITIEGDVGLALQELLLTLQKQSERPLSKLAALGGEITETAIAIGWTYHDFKEVAQSVAAISNVVAELTTAIARASDDSTNSAEQAAASRETMQCCIRDSRQTIGAMQKIEERMENIGERLTVLEGAVAQIGGMAGEIEAISRQTNLLALNATIEAARAGETGRGFAVVAQEVKALSLQTGNATKQIRTRLSTLSNEMTEISLAVKDSLTAVSHGSSVVKQVGAIIESAGDEMAEISDRIQMVSTILQEQRAATNNINTSVSCISGKATKTRDEMASIADRLTNAEALAIEALSNSSNQDTPLLPVLRFSLDAVTWKRQMSSILLGVTACPASAPTLQLDRAISAIRNHGTSSGANDNLTSELKTGTQLAQNAANSMVANIRTGNWEAATAAYVTLQDAVDSIVKDIKTKL